MDNFGGINGAAGQVPEPPQFNDVPPQPPQQPVGDPAMGMPMQAPLVEDPYQPAPPQPQAAMPITPGYEQPPMDPLQQPMPTDFGGMQQPLPPSMTEIPVAAAAGGSKKVLIIALAAVGALVLLGAAGFAGYSAGQSAGRNAALKEFQEQQAAQQQASNEEEEDQTESATLELGELRAPEYKDEVIEGVVGEQVEAGDGLVLMVTNIERNFRPNDPNYKLDETKELVKVNFLMGNVTKDKTKDMSNFNFRLETASGEQLTPESIAEYDGKFDTVKLDPGTQAEGSVIYAVNKDEKPLTFVRSQVYRITNQNREVTTKISILVAQ